VENYENPLDNQVVPFPGAFRPKLYMDFSSTPPPTMRVKYLAPLIFNFVTLTGEDKVVPVF
jgi:hypothetical protein